MSTTITDAFTSQYPSKELSSPMSTKNILKIFDALYDSIDKEIKLINSELGKDDSERGTRGVSRGSVAEVKRIYALHLDAQEKLKRVDARFKRIGREFGKELLKLHLEIHRDRCDNAYDVHDDDLVKKVIFAIADDILKKVLGRVAVMLQNGANVELVALTPADWGDE